MSDKIAVTDVKLKYATIQEAKTMSGLRLVLGASTVPGPWREACKGIFYVKGVPYTPVASAGQDGSQRELVEWTAQTSAPVAIWNDERPRSTWIEQLYLAERLQPEPALIPADADDRVSMFGLINEIAGENGLGWQRRHLMIKGNVSKATDKRVRELWQRYGGKYLFTRKLRRLLQRASHRSEISRRASRPTEGGDRMVGGQRANRGAEVAQLSFRSANPKQATVFLHHIDAGPPIGRIDHQVQRSVG